MPDRRRFLARLAWLPPVAVGSLLAMSTTRRAKAQDRPAAASAPLPGLRPLGQGTLRFMGLPIYDATLAVAPGFDPARPEAGAFSLSLAYHRRLSGADIVDRSIVEMKRGGGIAAADEARWRDFMARAFPDVARGDVIVGSWQPRGMLSRFVHNSGAMAELADPMFGPRFFGIWLAPHTSQPSLRAELLGLAR